MKTDPIGGIIGALFQTVVDLEAENAKLKARIAELEGMRPPESDSERLRRHLIAKGKIYRRPDGTYAVTEP